MIGVAVTISYFIVRLNQTIINGERIRERQRERERERE